MKPSLRTIAYTSLKYFAFATLSISSFLYSSFLQAAFCSKVMGVEASRSMQSTHQGHESAELIEYSTHKNWTTQELLGHTRKLLNFENYYSELLPQEVLLIHDFTINDQKLISMIWKKSFQKKYLNRAYADNFLENLVKLNKDIPDTEYAKKRVKENIKLYNNAASVEIGVFRILFKDGSYKTVFHTSSNHSAIFQETLLSALTAGFGKREYSEIKQIQYFHSHPVSGGVLSKGDLGFTKTLSEEVRSGDYEGGVHVYAITQYDGKFFIYHSDY